MDKLLRPSKLEVDPHSPDAGIVFKHWLQTFQRFRLAAKDAQPENERDRFDSYGLLVNYLAPRVFPYVEETDNYETAIEILKRTFEKTKNVVFARHLLATRSQNPEENLSEFLQALRELSKDCKFEAVTAEKYREEMLRDAFINGLTSSSIRQRLLEKDDLNLERAFDLALSLDRAQEQSLKYIVPVTATAAENFLDDTSANNHSCASASNKESSTTPSKKCFFCGGKVHPRSQCLAKDANCFKCGKKRPLRKSMHSKRFQHFYFCHLPTRTLLIVHNRECTKLFAIFHN